MSDPIEQNFEVCVISPHKLHRQCHYDHKFCRQSSFPIHLFHLAVLTVTLELNMSTIDSKQNCVGCGSNYKSLEGERNLSFFNENMCVFLNSVESSPHMNLKFLMLITYICPARLQLSNGKCLPMQQETSLHLHGFPLACFDRILCVT
jgi:hypothetical protein